VFQVHVLLVLSFQLSVPLQSIASKTCLLTLALTTLNWQACL